MLFEFPTATPPILEVVDVSNPLRPSSLCTLVPAQGGRFYQTANNVIFWTGNKLVRVNLTSGLEVQTAVLPAMPFEGTFSADGTEFAYRATGTDGSLSTHIYRVGLGDRLLYKVPPLGGHGGGPIGPRDQLQFSPDGTELLDYSEFSPATKAPNFEVFKSDGSIVFQSTQGWRGAWAPSGATLYFFVAGANGSTTSTLDKLDAGGGPQAFATQLNGSFWPAMSPSGAALLYTAYDSSVPGSAMGGLPHIWRVDLTTASTSQVSAEASSRPQFVTPGAYWSNEEKPCNCGPDGASQPDGVILAHDFGGRANGTVDWHGMLPGARGLIWSDTDTANIVDVWN